ncbi:MAG: DUF899 domain-containing protein [Rhodospirillaceae bacterium]|jgi:predicted dithiol-disulfide oxidoreductase (DUF899 family)|nr:DUF899 domain-containing protein [Rhodospirillaceae bacterium]MBT5564207.1 DUF899 domain-containing protein [Rhodospirillaceae bacterium]MBT6961149.1 DUF899 domain-containing protein [Rhodospirillaceae bacterium]
MTQHSVVSHEEWVEARKAFLAKEKEFSRLRENISQARRDLPWERVDADYVFTGPDGEEKLSDLFAGQSQLIVYHFMYGADWEAGCKSCSYMADHFNPAIVHLNARGISMVAASNAPLDKLDTFKARMGWSFKWVSSMGSMFNRDYSVSFTQEEIDSGAVYYNYKDQSFPMSEAPGVSVFFKDDDSAIYHTYSAYARGLDPMLTAYQYMDLAPKGRDEAELPYSMAWVTHHDSYD